MPEPSPKSRVASAPVTRTRFGDPGLGVKVLRDLGFRGVGFRDSGFDSGLG